MKLLEASKKCNFSCFSKTIFKCWVFGAANCINFNVSHQFLKGNRPCGNLDVSI